MWIRSACSAAAFVLFLGYPQIRSRLPSGCLTHVRSNQRPRLSRRTDMLLSLSAVPSTIAPECTPSLPPAEPGDERRPAEPDNPADALAGHLAAPHRLVELVATDAQERRGLGDVEHLLGL